MEGLIIKLMILIKMVVFTIFFILTFGKYNWEHFSVWWEKHDTDVLTTVTGSTVGIIDGVGKEASSGFFTMGDAHDIVMVIIKAIVGGTFAFITGKVIKYFSENKTNGSN